MAKTRFPRRGAVSTRRTDGGLSVDTVQELNVPLSSKLLVASIDIGGGGQGPVVVAPFTLVRTRGYFWIGSDQNAGGEVQTGAVGIAKVNGTAAALGITALPDPVTDSAWDGWWFHQYFGQKFQLGTNVGFIEPGAGGSYVIDSKAMRKFEDNDAIVIVAANGSASFGINIQLARRMLLKFA